MHKEAKAVLRKSQEEMERYSDRNRKETVEYKVRDRMLLSVKDLIWQMRNGETKKLIERFIKLYYIEKIRKYSRVGVTGVNEYSPSN